MIAWAEAVIGCQFRPDARAIGLTRSGALIAVVVFDTFGPMECMVSVAAEQGRAWLNRAFIAAVASYVFLQCAFPRITCTISDNNAASKRFCEHFGCSLEGRKRGAGPNGEDMLIYGLLRRECAWIPKTLMVPSRQLGQGTV
ncbi:hypothetical protein GCM10007913_11880 [Devosia yakushimensis]|uniref:N-acetyltransferase domain-containing protein n=2 Tax=Devosia yakushimensis TaxID=470028 RepID=A0ABQ5UBN5_9HYPH|nr:hypothetical protein GCM10007913_11880 [Devosia yakushimensis]